MILRRIKGCQGMTFGVMDGVITVIGVLVGLYVLGNPLLVIAGILIAGFAGSLANAAGIHVSQETEGKHPPEEVMTSTVLAFASTASVTIILVLPFFFLDMGLAVAVSVTMGLLFIAGVGVFVAGKLRKRGTEKAKLVAEYLLIVSMVIVLSYGFGLLVKNILGVS